MSFIMRVGRSMYLYYEHNGTSYQVEKTVEFTDFFEFMKPTNFDTWAREGKVAYQKACQDVFDSSWFSLEELEYDDEFVDFMTKRYEQEFLEGR